MLPLPALDFYAVRYGLRLSFGQYANADSPPLVRRNPLRTIAVKVLMCLQRKHKIYSYIN